jgi:transmembrane sensor
MSKAPLPDLGPVEQDAIAWVQKLAAGDITPAEIEALKRWCAQRRLHAVAFDEAKLVWGKVGAAGRIVHGPGEDFITELDALGRRRTMTRRTMLGSGVAAMAATSAYAMIDPPLGLWPSLGELSADYRTSKGEQRKVTFAKDVSISLNTQTSVAVRPSEGAEDRIELVVGEASFAKPAHAARSLVVLAADGRTASEAGRFDVRHVSTGRGAPVRVTCFEGRVRIEQGGEVADLGPGQRVHYDGGGLSRIASVDPDLESEWQRGIVEFRGMSLVEALEEMNRYRPGRIVLMSKALGEKRLSGRFRIDQMEQVLRQLEQAFGARLRRLPGDVVLLS